MENYSRCSSYGGKCCQIYLSQKDGGYKIHIGLIGGSESVAFIKKLTRIIT